MEKARVSSIDVALRGATIEFIENAKTIKLSLWVADYQQMIEKLKKRYITKQQLSCGLLNLKPPSKRIILG